MADTDKLSEQETKRRAEAALKKTAAAPQNHHAIKGKPNRADLNKGNAVKPTKQRIQRHQGR